MRDGGAIYSLLMLDVVSVVCLFTVCVAVRKLVKMRLMDGLVEIWFSMERPLMEDLFQF